MLIYPDFDPIALQLGPFAIRWYGITYLIGFLSGYLLLKRRIINQKLSWTLEQLGDLVFYACCGLLLGGRIGYTLFYDFAGFIQDPLVIFQVWKGGMSFHGGAIGVIVTLLFFAKKTQKTFFECADLMAPVIPIGLGAGRIGNFINGELWGRITDLPWGMASAPGALARHPSQLYEAFLEGAVLFLILWIFSAKPRPKMAVSGLFLVLYGCFRFSVEFVREPDLQLGFLAWNWLTMGQLLTLPMLISGFILLGYAYRQENKHANLS